MSSRSSTRAVVRLAVVAVLGMCALAAPADAATYTTTVSPDPFSYPETDQISYRLHITTADQPERLRISASAPSFPTGVTYSGWAVHLGQMTLEGAGVVLDRGGGSVVGDRFCMPVLPDDHGSSFAFYPSVDVEIPANTTSTIAVPGQFGASAPWPGMDLAVEFSVGPPGVRPVPVVRSPSPQNNGRQGVRIAFRTDPEGVPGGCPHAYTPVALGREVLVSGKADAVTAGQTMTIRSFRQGEQGPRDLASVPIAEDGTFAYRWRPTTPGDYTLGALYRSQSPKLADDFSMPTSLRVGQPPAPPPTTPTALEPAAVTTAGRVRCRGRRCAIAVRGSIERPAGALRAGSAQAGAGCTGRVRLRVGARGSRLLSTGVRVGQGCRYRATRRFRLKSRRTRFVTVGASYLGDALLRPKRGRTVRVRIRR